MRGFPLADSVAASVCPSVCHRSFDQNGEPCLRCLYFTFPLNPFLIPSRARSANCAACQSGGLALSGNSTEQTERGIQLKCWKTFRKEGDVTPPPSLQLGGVATASSRPPCSPDSCSGNSRQDETHPDTPSAPDCVTDQDDALNIRSGFFLFLFFLSLLTFGPLNIRVRGRDGKRRSFGFCGRFQAAAFHLRG